MRARLTALCAALMLLVLLRVPLTAPPAAAMNATPLGADVIGPDRVFPAELALFSAMRGQIARFRLEPGYGMRPADVQALITAGARTVVLQAGGCGLDSTAWLADATPYQAVIAANPATRFVYELGNEPNVCGEDAWSYRWWALTIRREDAALSHPNVRWTVSLPTDLADARIVMSAGADGSVASAYDGVSLHLYGDYALLEGHYDYDAVYRWILSTTSLPIWVTEVGINDAATPKATKAARIVSAVESMPSRVQGVMVFVIGDPGSGSWPQYQIDGPMAAAFAARLAQYQGPTPAPTATLAPAPTPAPAAPSPCTAYPATGQSICYGFRSFWDANGGLPIFGYPLTGEVRENGLSVQYFERAVFEYHPDNPDPYKVELRRLGAAALSQRTP